MDSVDFIVPILTGLFSITSTVITLKVMLKNVVEDLQEIKAGFKDIERLTGEHGKTIAVLEHRVKVLEASARYVD